MPSLSGYSGRTHSSHSQSSGRDYGDSGKYVEMIFSNDSDSFDDSSTRRDSRLPSTHDLAEFLRSSKPEDFKYSPSHASTAPDDMVIFNKTPRRGLARFLRPMTPREPLENIKEATPKEQPPTISKAVKVEKTVEGKPYLAIQVDYPPLLLSTDNCLPALPTLLSDESSKRDSLFTSSGLSSDFYPSRSSMTSTSGREPSIYSRNLMSSDGRPSPSFWDNVPWNQPSETESLIYCSVCQIQHASKADHCTILEQNLPAKTSSNVPPILSLKSSGSKVRQRPEPLKRLSVASIMSNGPLSVSPGLYSTMPRLSRNSSNGQRKLFPSSPAHKSSFSPESDDSQKNLLKEEIEEVDEPIMQKKAEQSNTTPPQPGPPPSRGLPSLPEAHNDALNLATKIRNVSSARSLPEDQFCVSTVEPNLFSQISMPELSPRKQREALVKARKMKDLQTIQKRRDPDSSVSSVDEEVLDRARLKPFQSTNTYKNSPTIPKARASRPSRLYKPKSRSPPLALTPIMTVYDQQPVIAPDFSTVSSPTDSDRPVRSLHRLSLLSSAESEQPTKSQKRLSLLSNNSSSVHSYVQRDACTPERSSIRMSRDSELELRMLNMERRNMLLEQALLAVLRGPVYNDNQIADHYRKPSLLQDLLLQSQNVPHHVTRDSRASSGGYSLSSMQSSIIPAA